MITSLVLPMLRFVFLAGLLVFVARVVRAVLADLDVRAVPGAAARTLFVVEQPEALRGREFLVVGEATIGRAPECAIMLQDGYVSSHHARVFVRGGRLWVEDLKSTNGTLVNGQRVRRPSALRPGDRLQIGDAVLTLRVEPAAGAAVGRGPGGAGRPGGEP
ncbi:MAG TPA: FHA domain-containing protein [bacterium]|nr:FHA domain-containing protein [bacterium]